MYIDYLHRLKVTVQNKELELAEVKNKCELSESTMVQQIEEVKRYGIYVHTYVQYSSTQT